MKRLISLAFVMMSACASVPPVKDPILASRLSSIVSQYEHQNCQVTGYRNEGHQTDGGMVNLFARKTRRSEGLPPITFTSYIVQCNGDKVYAVELPDDEAIRPRTLPCTNRNATLAGGDCVYTTHR